jgi:hypothetical protein
MSLLSTVHWANPTAPPSRTVAIATRIAAETRIVAGVSRRSPPPKMNTATAALPPRPTSSPQAFANTHLCQTRQFKRKPPDRMVLGRSRAYSPCQRWRRTQLSLPHTVTRGFVTSRGHNALGLTCDVRSAVSGSTPRYASLPTPRQPNRLRYPRLVSAVGAIGGSSAPCLRRRADRKCACYTGQATGANRYRSSRSGHRCSAQPRP